MAMNLDQSADKITPSSGTLSIPASIAITVGSINGTIGGVTPAAITATTVTATSGIAGGTF
jgi:hypothetical protein